MGRRRRTKIQRRPRPKLPNIFDCPLCSKKTVSITFNKQPNSFNIKCKNCGKRYHYNNPTRIPVKFGCPNCDEKSVTIEFIESTYSIRINCSSCGESTFVSAREWESDPERFSVVKLVPRGAKLGCPKCNFRTILINITLQKDFAVVLCGACGFKTDFPVTPLDEKVDVYGQFIDKVRSQEFMEEMYSKEKLKAEAELESQGGIQETNIQEAQGSEEKFDTEDSSQDEISDWDD
ncbi:MAG: hypothetical protein HWN66_13770 [Candidatus Helarchaeota archaeon]|nr:hypothetical protein [Candidatus Helarchaeota archaeon]